MSEKNKTIIVYKAVFGDYDFLPAPPNYNGNKFRHVLLSDKLTKIKGWDSVVVNKNDMTDTFANRFFKFFPWEVFPGLNTIYTDGHLELKSNFYEYIERSGQMPEFACPTHRSYGTVFDEFLRNLDAEKLSASDIKKFSKKNFNLKRHAVECGLILRNHNNDNLKSFAQLWWEFFNEICPRDQLLINEAALKTRTQITRLPFTLNNNDYFKIHPHKNAKIKILSKRILVSLRILLRGKILP